jgi:hypothetical protein
MRDVLRTTEAAMQDPAVGLSAKMVLVAQSGELLPLRTEFTFGRWGDPDTALKDARRHNVVSGPASGSDQTKVQDTWKRDGQQRIEVAIEVFGADTTERQDNIIAAQLALLMVLDGLRAYSDAQTPPGTIIEVVDPVETRYGEFETGTSGGFVSVITINERSAS